MPTTQTDSATIAYDVHGEGDPLLLIMGFAADARMWMFQVPAFAQHYRCITFDNRGVGSSTGQVEGLSMETMARDALAVLDAAGVERAHIVGISLGGAIAQHVALLAPERVRSLVLASTWCARNDYLPRLGRLGQKIMDKMGHETVVEASMLWLFTTKFLIEQGALLDQVEQYAVQFAVEPETFLEQQRALYEHHTIDQLDQIQAPTMIMVGRKDVFVPPELSEQIAAAMPGAEFVKIDGGHAYNIEEVEQFNRTVLDFLAKH